jgi:hypothetical protein
MAGVPGQFAAIAGVLYLAVSASPPKDHGSTPVGKESLGVHTLVKMARAVVAGDPDLALVGVDVALFVIEGTAIEDSQDGGFGSPLGHDEVSA